MSTRCVVNFTWNGEVEAKIYRHHDGYPDSEHGVIAALQRFFADVEAETRDTRFDDPSYLAAKFVLWQQKTLANIGCGVLREDPGDIAFRYFVDCGTRDAKDRPTVRFEAVR